MRGNSTDGPSWLLRGTGVVLGCPSAAVSALSLLLAGVLLGPFLLWPGSRPFASEGLHAWVRRLAALERGRRAVFFGDRFPARYRASDGKLLRYLAVRSGAGLVCAAVIGLLGFGAVLAGLLVRGALRGSLGWADLLTQVLLGGVLLFLGVQGLWSLTALDARLARDCFGPSEAELLRQRVAELADSRAAVLRAVDAERRRIERDLHDGVQQRVVALAMLLGRARRGHDPERAGELLRQAHQEAREVLTELREVAWRAYPSALDTLGLEEALGGVAERSAIPLRTRYEVAAPLPEAVRTAAYFTVSECVTNAVKHSAATELSVRVTLIGDTACGAPDDTPDDTPDGAGGASGGPALTARRVRPPRPVLTARPVLTVRVSDDGVGGADPAGGGLSGLRGRLAALDGTLHIDSPLGGPTVITAELPCA